MELLTLDPSFQPLDVVDNYSSLIWTERYATNGDFELKTTDISAAMQMLPRESYVSIRESKVPMIVEAHKIEKPKNSAPIITVTGRSFETVLERRASVKGALPLTTALPVWRFTETDALKSSDVAYLVMRTVLGDTAKVIPSGGSLAATNAADMASPLDAIPQIELILPADFTLGGTIPAWSNSTTYGLGARAKYQNAIYASLVANNVNHAPTDAAYWRVISGQSTWDIPAQDLLKTVTDLIATNRHGIKAVRPNSSGTKVGIEIYNGANLTGVGENSDPNKIYVFDARFDQFDSANYLFTETGSTNVGYIYGPGGGEVVNKTAAAEPSGLARRVLASVTTDAANAEARRSRGLVGLYQNNVTSLFDGEIAEQVAMDFNVNYFLGDILALYGEYGLKTYARVAEYIRTSDATGESAYPTLEVVDIT